MHGFLLILSLSSLAGTDSCEVAYDLVEQGHSLMHEAVQSYGLRDLRVHAQKAIDISAEALIQIERCRCEDASSEVLAAALYARHAFDAVDMKEGRYLARRARADFDSALSLIEECSERK